MWAFPTFLLRLSPSVFPFYSFLKHSIFQDLIVMSRKMVAQYLFTTASYVCTSRVHICLTRVNELKQLLTQNCQHLPWSNTEVKSCRAAGHARLLLLRLLVVPDRAATQDLSILVRLTIDYLCPRTQGIQKTEKTAQWPL